MSFFFFLPFNIVHRVLKARILVVCHSLLQQTMFYQTLHHDSSMEWMALHGMAHSFIELDKAVIHVISLFVFCDFGFLSVCPLMDKEKRFVEAS